MKRRINKNISTNRRNILKKERYRKINNRTLRNNNKKLKTRKKVCNDLAPKLTRLQRKRKKYALPIILILIIMLLICLYQVI